MRLLNFVGPVCTRYTPDITYTSTWMTTVFSRARSRVPDGDQYNNGLTIRQHESLISGKCYCCLRVEVLDDLRHVLTS